MDCLRSNEIDPWKFKQFFNFGVAIMEEKLFEFCIVFSQLQIFPIKL